MNKRTKKALALAAAVTSLGASLGVAQSAENWETHEIKAGSANSIKHSDYMKLDNSANTTQNKLSNQQKTPIILQGGKSSSQSKTANTIKLKDSTSTQSKGSNAIKWENNK
jgi:hypothetical protein